MEVFLPFYIYTYEQKNLKYLTFQTVFNMMLCYNICIVKECSFSDITNVRSVSASTQQLGIQQLHSAKIYCFE